MSIANLTRRVDAVTANAHPLDQLTPAEIASWRAIEGAQPAITPDEAAECRRVARNCPEILAAIRKRDLTDPDLVMLYPWSEGRYDDEPR